MKGNPKPCQFFSPAHGVAGSYGDVAHGSVGKGIQPRGGGVGG